MRIPMAALKLTLVVPALVMSVALTAAVLVLLPPLLALPAWLAVIAVLVVAATGSVDRQLAAALTGSRPASAGERAVLATILDGRAHAVGPVELYVRRTGGGSMPAVRIGRDMLVVTPWFVDAVYRHQITADEATAVVIHAQGAHTAGAHRFETVTLLVTAPWRGLLAVCRGIGLAFAWFPLVRALWALRGVVGAVAVGQSIVEGRAWVGVCAGVFVTLTYVVPAARRVRERAMLSAGDDLVIAHDLGMVLVGLLRRGGIPLDLDRQVGLERRDGSGVAPTEATARPTAAL